MMFYAIEVAYLFVNLGIAYVHSRLILHNKPIVHWMWAAFYIVFMAVGYWFTKSWLLLGTSLLIREVVFAQVLNLLRKKRFFYINPDTGSVIDRIEGKGYKYIWFGSLASLLFIQFIKKKNPDK